jgi:DsbC/DsbD-like thiol-disulfide interchange protein
MNRFQKFAVIAFCLLAAPAEAAMTDWQDIGGGRARLLAVEDPGSRAVFAALEIELKEGWKTYWRQPGSSGIPPQLDFSRSTHFIAGEVKIPAPRILAAGDAHFAGYKGTTAFYFEGQALDPDGVIRLELFAGVCQEICIPAQASFEIPLSALNGSDPKAETLIAMARDGLPREPRPGFAISGVTRKADWSLEITAELPAGDKTHLFVEGPQGWYFPWAELVTVEAGKAVFRVGPPEMPKDVASPPQLRFTLTDGAAAIEQWLTPAN